ncbi:hypothetical protein CW745_03515 [Psychromonas sp. psych-6C06]|uniref:hypothetical protein n=1 Tax=Psychromonas sp. psych-6C06 TaxID=2058089 RepID=UPI000C3255E7|nr:hypothetical protein [Psychromonas sp. psych-6C06]PKF62514.1 hypothetical protein CW745_03515 [Psychromonas sp. psych-6C06]
MGINWLEYLLNKLVLARCILTPSGSNVMNHDYKQIGASDKQTIGYIRYSQIGLMVMGLFTYNLAHKVRK